MKMLKYVNNHLQKTRFSWHLPASIYKIFANKIFKKTIINSKHDTESLKSNVWLKYLSTRLAAFQT